MNSHTRLKQAWANIKFGTRRLKKKSIEISIKTKVALDEQHDCNWNQKKEKYGSPRFRAGTNRGLALKLAKNQGCKEYKKVCRLW